MSSKPKPKADSFDELLAAPVGRPCPTCANPRWLDLSTRYVSKWNAGETKRSAQWLHKHLVENEKYPYSSPDTLRVHLRKCLGWQA